MSQIKAYVERVVESAPESFVDQVLPDGAGEGLLDPTERGTFGIDDATAGKKYTHVRAHTQEGTFRGKSELVWF